MQKRCELFSLHTLILDEGTYFLGFKIQSTVRYAIALMTEWPISKVLTGSKRTRCSEILPCASGDGEMTGWTLVGARGMASQMRWIGANPCQLGGR